MLAIRRLDAAQIAFDEWGAGMSAGGGSQNKEKPIGQNASPELALASACAPREGHTE